VSDEIKNLDFGLVKKEAEKKVAQNTFVHDQDEKVTSTGNMNDTASSGEFNKSKKSN